MGRGLPRAVGEEQGRSQSSQPLTEEGKTFSDPCDVASALLAPSLRCLIRGGLHGALSPSPTLRDTHSKPHQLPGPGIHQGSWSIRGQRKRSPVHLSTPTASITGHRCSPGSPQSPSQDSLCRKPPGAGQENCPSSCLTPRCPHH